MCDICDDKIKYKLKNGESEILYDDEQMLGFIGDN